MFQTPQRRAGGGIMAGVAPINEAMGPMKLEDGGDPGFLDRIRSYYDENLSGIPAGLEYMREEGMGIPLFGEGGILFDPDDPLDQLSVGLLVFPPAAAAARLASMGVKGYKLFRQMRKINKVQKEMGIDPSRLEKANPFQADPIKALQGGATTSAAIKGTAEAIDLPEVIADVPKILEIANEVGQGAELLKYIDNEQIDNNGIMGLIQDADVESELADLDRAEQLEERAEQDFDDQVARSIAEAREMGVDTFVNKAGKELAAVTKEELDEFRSLPGNEDLGYTEALRKYLNEKNAMEMNRGGIAKLNLGGEVFSETKKPSNVVKEKSTKDVLDEINVPGFDEDGRPSIKTSVIASQRAENEGISYLKALKLIKEENKKFAEAKPFELPEMYAGEIDEIEAPRPGFFDMLRNMDDSTAAGFAALTSRRPRGQSAISAFMEGKMDYRKQAAEAARDEAATIPGQVAAYREIFPDITDEQLQDLILSGGKSQEQQIRELAIDIYTQLLKDEASQQYPDNLIDATEQQKQDYLLSKAIRDATRIVTGDLEGLVSGSGVDIDLLNKEEA